MQDPVVFIFASMYKPMDLSIFESLDEAKRCLNK